jgi:hypothetical protein
LKDSWMPFANYIRAIPNGTPVWPAPGFEDTEIGVFMEPGGG